MTRHFGSFLEAEAGESRIYGSIHWEFDNQDALVAGQALGNLVVDSYLQPVDE